ncbi:hypothetical protein BDZ97DRAFT_1768022 [Flammula alnicola]|nr:hypothetical protein BDZ97DRAFT_1768022 [Flammula alnicola]
MGGAVVAAMGVMAVVGRRATARGRALREVETLMVESKTQSRRRGRAVVTSYVTHFESRTIQKKSSKSPDTPFFCFSGRPLLMLGDFEAIQPNNPKAVAKQYNFPEVPPFQWWNCSRHFGPQQEIQS